MVLPVRRSSQTRARFSQRNLTRKNRRQAAAVSLLQISNAIPEASANDEPGTGVTSNTRPITVSAEPIVIRTPLITFVANRLDAQIDACVPEVADTLNGFPVDKHGLNLCGPRTCQAECQYVRRIGAQALATDEELRQFLSVIERYRHFGCNGIYSVRQPDFQIASIATIADECL